MSDGDFYQRLTELKREHKKTLEFCEKLYNEKLSTSVDFGQQKPIGNHVVDSNYHVSSSTLNGSFGASPEVSRMFSGDYVRDMSAAKHAKPPTGRPKPSPDTPTSLRSPGVRQVWTATKSDDDPWRAASGNSSEADHSDDELRRSSGRDRSFTEARPDSRQSTRSRVDDMWDNFSVDEYAPQKIRQRSNSRQTRYRQDY